LPAELTRAFVSLWTQYAGRPPSDARTEIRGNARLSTGRTAMNPETPGAPEATDARFVMLEAEARYARERYQLYKAKAYASRPTSPRRLRELERKSVLATRRLDRARADQEPVAR
jgi:hypothetical protein